MRNTDKLLLAGILFWGFRSLTAISLPLYLLSQGVSLSAIAFSKSIQLVIIGLFSFATGALSDRFGAKSSVVLASGLQVLYFFIIADASLMAVYVAEALNGLSLALYNGCYEKWLHDEKDSGFSRNYGLYQKWRFLLMGGLVFTGGLFRESALYAAGALLFFVTILFVSCRENLPELKPQTNYHKEKKPFYVRPRLLVLCIFYITGSAMMVPVYTLWPTQFVLANVKVYPGTIYLAAMVLQWLVMHYLGKLPEQYGLRRTLYFLVNSIVPAGTLMGLSLLMLSDNPMFLQPLSVTAMFLMLSMPTAALSMCFMEMNRMYAGSRASFISLIDTLIKLFSSLVMFVLTYNQATFLATTWLAVSALFLLSLIPVACMLVSHLRASTSTLKD
ncbi:hypothetical protein [Pantoea agglomerans]|uniref:hypothetical protein n=1 Tax=Enterobacter agglomerans TaxID=549 RepID=UPI003209844D